MSFDLVSHLQYTAMLPAPVKDDANQLILGSARISFYKVKILKKYNIIFSIENRSKFTLTAYFASPLLEVLVAKRKSYARNEIVV